MQRTSFLTSLLFSFSLCLASTGVGGCAAKTLDGGSTGDTAGAGTGSGNGAGGAGADIAEAPLSGTIAGRPFEAKNIDVTYDTRYETWRLSIDNYENDCGSRKTPPPADDAMTVNVGALQPAAGTYPIAYGDAHAATLQVGVYEANAQKAPETLSARSGTLRLDVWSETPGTTIEGALKLVADDGSTVEGTFTAKVCAPR